MPRPKFVGNKIVRIYTRSYRCHDTSRCYVEWSDGSCTKGKAADYHGVLVPCSVHMGALFDCALSQGLTIGREVW